MIENDYKKTGSGGAWKVERLDNKTLYRIMTYCV